MNGMFTCVYPAVMMTFPSSQSTQHSFVTSKTPETGSDDIMTQFQAMYDVTEVSSVVWELGNVIMTADLCLATRLMKEHEF